MFKFQTFWDQFEAVLQNNGDLNSVKTASSLRDPYDTLNNRKSLKKTLKNLQEIPKSHEFICCLFARNTTWRGLEGQKLNKYGGSKIKRTVQSNTR